MQEWGENSPSETSFLLKGNILLLVLFLLLTFGLASCTTQINSEVEHSSFGLQPNDLEIHGVGFLTPAAATGQETDKQSLSLMFADELAQMRPYARVAPLPEVLSAVNESGLADEYKQMYRDYLQTGILEQDVLSSIGEVAGVRYLVQLSLAGFAQGANKRLGVLGLRLIDTKQATMRVFMQIWDSQTGSVVWEGAEEVHFAYDTSSEKPVTFKAIAERTARGLFELLPGADPSLVAQD
jgi:hypothetical protein